MHTVNERLLELHILPYTPKHNGSLPASMVPCGTSLSNPQKVLYVTDVYASKGGV